MTKYAIEQLLTHRNIFQGTHILHPHTYNTAINTETVSPLEKSDSKIYIFDSSRAGMSEINKNI